MANDENPYDSPLSSLTPERPAELTYEQAVAIRQQHLSAEKSYEWLAIFVAITSICSPALTWKLLEIDQALTLGTISLLVHGIVAVPMLVIAFGIYDLQPAAREWGTSLAYLGFLGLPIFPFVSFVLLRALNSQLGEFLFSQFYCKVRTLTPQLNEPRSMWTLIIICLGSLLGAGLLLYF